MHLIYFSQIDPMTSQGYVWKMIKITLILPWSGLCKEINECIYKNIVIQLILMNEIEKDLKCKALQTK